MNSAVEHTKHKRKPTLRMRSLSLYGLTLLALLVGVIASSKFHWHERAWYFVATRINASHWKHQSIWLPDYRVSIEAKPVAGIDDDLSAIDFAKDRQRLLAVTNAAPMKLVEMNREGQITAQYPLEGFQDVEGLAYMGNGLVALADERLQQLVIVHLPVQNGATINKKDAPALALTLTSSANNKGVEGITYDTANDRMFVAKERNPRRLYAVTGLKASLGGTMQLKVEDLSEWIDRSVFATDISDLHFDESTGHLLVLSDESKLIIELSESGDVVSSRTLLGGISDLKESAKQPEGLTIDDQGDLYVVSEPNFFYRFQTN